MKRLGKSGSHRGFTLIEMLIVIAIIGILASIVLVGLGPVQRRGRDARRQSDLREVQNALELYFNKCGHYPGDGECGDTPASDWKSMSSALKEAGIGVTQIPNDPSTGGDPDSTKNYNYATDDSATTYVLEATFEDTGNPSLNDSMKTPPPGVSGIDCAGKGHYCISL